MSRGRVLIIEADEWLTTLLSKFLSDAGYTTQTATTARAGFDDAVANQPDCVLCDVALPDIDGFWVTRRIRTDKSKLAGTPILLLAQKEDHLARLEGLALGADVFLTPPFRYDEVIAQVDALLGMAMRLRARRDSVHTDAPTSTGDAAVSGDLSQISVPTFLTMLEMERRTGRVRVQVKGKASDFNRGRRRHNRSNTIGADRKRSHRRFARGGHVEEGKIHIRTATDRSLPAATTENQHAAD